MIYFGTVLGGKHEQQEERSEPMELVYMDDFPYLNDLLWYCFRWQARATRRKERTNGIGLHGRQERAVYTK
nr:MAG TPA: hypothetical protein [Caudoviricetes sp.]